MKSIAKRILAIMFGDRRVVMRIRRGLFKGIYLRIRPRDQLSLIFGNTEPQLQRLLHRYIKKNDIVFDVGANIGYVSIAMSKLVGDEGRVYAFEPIPKTADECRQNIKLNNCSNVTVFQKALSDSASTVEFRIPNFGKTDSMASMVWHQSGADIECIEVHTMVVDEDETLQYSTPTFVKIDVEGAEGMVVIGMRNLIEKSRPIIFVECSELGRETVWKLLKALDYKCFLARDQTDEILKFEAYHHDDFLWLPQNRTSGE